MAERVRVRQTDDDEGQRLLRIIRRGSGSVMTWAHPSPWRTFVPSTPSPPPTTSFDAAFGGDGKVVFKVVLRRGRAVCSVQKGLDLRAEHERHAAAGARGSGAGLVGNDGVMRRRLEFWHQRLPATVFGTARVTCCAWRAPGTPNAYPAGE